MALCTLRNACTVIVEKNLKLDGVKRVSALKMIDMWVRFAIAVSIVVGFLYYISDGESMTANLVKELDGSESENEDSDESKKNE